MGEMDVLLLARLGDDNLFRQLFEAEADELRGLGLVAGRARGCGDRGRSLRLAVAEIDEGGDRVRDPPRRARLLDRAGQSDHTRIDIGERRRLVLELSDDALRYLRANARRA